jgi:hypothetical protein
MSESIASAVESYVRAATERDPELRAKLLETCFAEQGRFLTRSREMRGRVAVAAMLTRFHEDPRRPSIRLLGAVDATGRIFRFRSLVEHQDGRTDEFFDAGEIDSDGKICLLMSFSGPLAAADVQAAR